MTEYTQPIPRHCTIMTVFEFKSAVRGGALIDYDGYGNAMKDQKRAVDIIKPSNASTAIPKDATHIVWFNK